MASFTQTDVMIIINGVTLSDHGNAVTVTDNRPEIDNSAYGGTAKSLTKGLGEASIDITLYQDFAAGKTHATLQPLIGSTTPVAVEVRATSAARSATNPAALLASALMFNYNFLQGGIGEMSMTTATFKNASPTGGMTYPTA